MAFRAIFVGVALMFLSSCAARTSPRCAVDSAPESNHGRENAIVFLERSNAPLAAYGTVSVRVTASPCVDRDELARFQTLFSTELSRCLRSRTQLSVVPVKKSSDLTLELHVTRLAYVDFFTRISGMAMFRKAVLSAEITLTDNYYSRRLWLARVQAHSLPIEGAVAASTTTQVFALADSLAQYFQNSMY